MTNEEKIGIRGEKAAVAFLKERNYKVLETNWRYFHKELDIIAEFNQKLIVVEVKTRLFDFFENPQDAVSKKKQKNIVSAANAYVTLKNIDLEVQFDIITVALCGDECRIQHIEDAFGPLA